MGLISRRGRLAVGFWVSFDIIPQLIGSQNGRPQLWTNESHAAYDDIQPCPTILATYVQSLLVLSSRECDWRMRRQPWTGRGRDRYRLPSADYQVGESHDSRAPLNWNFRLKNFLVDKHKRRIVKCFLWFYIRVLGSCTRRRRDRSPTPPYEPIHLGVNKKIKISRFFYVFPFRSSSSRFLYPAVRAPLYNLSSVEPFLCPEPSVPSLLLPL